ncbi:epimerase [Leptospira kobayashii]|uniref:Epimerase n=1 Tax=Leptospira kobayashii TaxID=1917830 RepID=A0ABM7US69_9LEPT|nr:NAD-dependent epimerase/dehydratase family protein [Leptospira kobayashii]BDA78691.1 epimerase [Leptospira kobayashii]
MKQKIKVLLTGATGMVGEGVLHECLKSEAVESVLLVSRKPSNIKHPKVKEIIVPQFSDLSGYTEELKGYDVCYFCLGVSSAGMKEEKYRELTYTLTLDFAKLISKLNPDSEFFYISGKSTDSSEKGSIMWARVKGKTENDLRKLGFAKVYAVRPGYLHPTPGLKNTIVYYHYITWAYPMLRKFFPKSVSTLEELGRAMISVSLNGYEKDILEVEDIIELAK